MGGRKNGGRREEEWKEGGGMEGVGGRRRWRREGQQKGTKNGTKENEKVDNIIILYKENCETKLAEQKA